MRRFFDSRKVLEQTILNGTIEVISVFQLRSQSFRPFLDPSENPKIGPKLLHNKISASMMESLGSLV